MTCAEGGGGGGGRGGGIGRRIRETCEPPAVELFRCFNICISTHILLMLSMITDFTLSSVALLKFIQF